MLVGYARTSTADQKAGLDAQGRELKAAGCEKIFAEQIYSAAQRPKLAECLSFLREGDTLVCTKPDRLVRSTGELLTIEADLTKRGVGLVIQSMGLDTRNGSNPTARLMLTILIGLWAPLRRSAHRRQHQPAARSVAATVILIFRQVAGAPSPGRSFWSTAPLAASLRRLLGAKSAGNSS